MTDQLARLVEMTGKWLPLFAKKYTCECCAYLDTKEFYVVTERPALNPELAEAICAAMNTIDALVKAAKAAKEAKRAWDARYGCGSEHGPQDACMELMGETLSNLDACIEENVK